MRLSRSLRGRLAAALVCTLTLAGVIAAPTAASAAAYRYWGFFTADDSGAWGFATKGAAQTTPKDGDVEGWRFAIAGDTPRFPRTTPDFDEVCGDATAGDGEKRVAVYVDSGLADEAPKGDTPPEPFAACAVVEAGASSQDALAAIADVRADASSGLLCGIGGYPSTACSDEISTAPSVTDPEPQVDFTIAGSAPQAQETAAATPTAGPTEETTPEPAAATEDEGSNSALPFVLIAALVVVVLGGSGMAYSRRRSGSEIGDDTGPSES